MGQGHSLTVRSAGSGGRLLLLPVVLVVLVVVTVLLRGVSSAGGRSDGVDVWVDHTVGDVPSVRLRQLLLLPLVVLHRQRVRRSRVLALVIV